MNKSGKNQGKEIRPPVVAILGHIDHGKSTLIDYIRKTNITAREAGGITQHVSAYEVRHTLADGREARITILDTPGHEAFTGVRSRGAGAADIAALIVSAEDGVKPQTLEVYKHIKESGLPHLVAITKIDKPTADIARTKQNLAEHGIYVEGFGGDTPVVEVSGKTGQGVDDFLEMVALMADLDEKQADTEVLGRGIIIESRLDTKRGIIGTGIIKDGTVRTGLFAAAKAGQAATVGTIAPLRFFLDAEDNMAEELSFSSPIQIVGWDKMPAVGTEFRTFLKKEEAQEYANEIPDSTRSDLGNQDSRSDLLNAEAAILPLIIKTDTAGSLEAVIGEISKLARERIAPKVVLSGVGSISENDVKTAMTAPGTLVLGFNTKTDAGAASLAERTGIEMLSYNIIYELTDKVKTVLEGREPKVQVEEVTGSAKILKIFSATKNKQVLGGRVNTGSVESDAQVRIIRRETEIGRGRIRELQQAKSKTGTVSEGNEFGALIESKIEIAPGDMIEVVKMAIK